MRTVLLRTIALSIAALCATVAWGQTPVEESRVLPFTHSESPQQLQEIASLVGRLSMAPGYPWMRPKAPYR
jgi:hypothetical protein